MTTLHIVDPFPPHDLRLPGMMWRYNEGWWIVLPTHPDIGTPGHPYELSWRTTDEASSGGTWEIRGSAPLLTVTPSIDVFRYVRNAEGKRVREGSYWHGFITNGVLVPS